VNCNLWRVNREPLRAEALLQFMQRRPVVFSQVICHQAIFTTRAAKNRAADGASGRVTPGDRAVGTFRRALHISRLLDISKKVKPSTLDAQPFRASAFRPVIVC
jgi:hypothetical protein